MDDLRVFRRELNRTRLALRQLADKVKDQFISQGEATQAAVADLAAGLAAVVDALAAVNAKTQRAVGNVAGLAVGNVDVTLTWPDEWPDTAYAVIATIVSGTGALGSLTATLKVGSKTVTGCVVTVANTGPSAVGAFAVDAIGIRT